MGVGKDAKFQYNILKIMPARPARPARQKTPGHEM